jgi:hypothetical protein
MWFVPACAALDCVAFRIVRGRTNFTYVGSVIALAMAVAGERD